MGATVKTPLGDRLVIDGLLGSGRSGTIYLVHDRRDIHARFALKEVIHPNKHDRERFIFEGEVLKRLDHRALPHVQQVFEREELKRVYLLMDFIEGRNLEVLYKRQPDQRFALPLVLALLASVVDALIYLHRQAPPIVHRDVKPSNIIVPQGAERTVLVDFGSAKEYIAGGATTLLTHRSPGYAAPEQYGGGTTPLTDIYGLGATLYTLLTGVVPTDAITRVSRNRSRGSDLLRPLSVLAPTVPTHVAGAIERAMSLDARDRFESIDQFWQVLSASQEGQTVPTSGMRIENALPPTASRRAIDPRSTGKLPVPASMPPVTPIPPILDSVEAMLPGGRDESRPYESRSKETRPYEVPVVPATPAVFPGIEPNSTSPTLSSPPFSGAEKQQKVFSRKWIALVVLVFVLVVGASLWVVVGVMNHASMNHSYTNHSPASSPIPTVESSASASGSIYPLLAGMYTGTMYDITGKVKTNIALTGIQQNQGRISGYLVIGSHLQGSGPFSGTIDAAGHVQFTVTDASGRAVLFFEGTLQSASSLSGDYYRCGTAQGGQCARVNRGYGIWNVVVGSSAKV